MDNTKRTTRVVGDLGISAYILMHGFKLAGKKDRSFVFFVEDDKIEQFNQLKFNYLFSEFHYFDHCLMGLKKLEDYMPASNPMEEANISSVNDLGIAAYLLMHKFKICAKRSKTFYFETPTEEERKQFDETNWQYTSSEYHEFDSKIMSLKKIVDSYR